MDDESGWNTILVDGWGPLVRAAVCDRVDEALQATRGILMIAVTSPDDAPANAVERVHDAILEAIAVETGADLDKLGSQSAWATYDDVWAELGRRWAADPGLEVVHSAAEHEVVELMELLPRDAIEHAGAVIDGAGRIRLVRIDGIARLDTEGMFRWLALDETADEATRARARAAVIAARRRP